MLMLTITNGIKLLLHWQKHLMLMKKNLEHVVFRNIEIIKYVILYLVILKFLLHYLL